MKKFLLSSKFLGGLSALSLIGVLTLSSFSNSLGSKQSGLYQLSNGLGICFQRVNQSFTALMIRDFSSDFITNDFKSMTGECFSEISSVLGTQLSGNKVIAKRMNNLMSDIHWFNEKIERVAGMAQKSDIELTESNIIDKYIEIEQLKGRVDETLVTSAEGINSQKSLAVIALVLSQLALLFSFFTLFLKRRILKQELSNIETIVKEEASNGDINLFVQNISNKLFKLLNIPETQSMMVSFQARLIEENHKLQDDLISAHTLGMSIDQTGIVIEENELASEEVIEEKIETSDFNNSLNIVLDRVKGKAFNHGIIIDTEISEEIEVNSSEEALDQLLFSIISYAMDSSLEHNEGRKVIIKGKPLGGIAYCKLKVEGYSFSDEDIKIINGKEVNSDTNMNLVLLKELLIDTNANLAVKNRFNSSNGLTESEIELIFERAKPSIAAQKEISKIVKGTKKELKAYFAQNAPMA
jgi:hypothetical protein